MSYPACVAWVQGHAPHPICHAATVRRKPKYYTGKGDLSLGSGEVEKSIRGLASGELEQLLKTQPQVSHRVAPITRGLPSDE